MMFPTKACVGLSAATNSLRAWKYFSSAKLVLRDAHDTRTKTDAGEKWATAPIRPQSMSVKKFAARSINPPGHSVFKMAERILFNVRLELVLFIPQNNHERTKLGMATAKTGFCR